MKLSSNWKTYYLVARNTWDETIVYRLNFVVWRSRVVLQLITTYFLWLTLLPKNVTFAGYSQSTMLTYILAGSFLNSVIFSTRTQQVADDIVQGDLSNYLIRPLNYFWYYFTKDIGDKAMNIAFSIVEIGMLLFFLRPPFFIQTNFLALLLFFFAVAIATVMIFYINMLLGFIGFWSSEVWAPRFIFTIITSFFAGSLFPLNILPKPLFSFFQLLPFTYLLYFPLKIYLGGLSLSEILLGFCMSTFWMVALAFAVQAVWKKGILLYSAEGR